MRRNFYKWLAGVLVVAQTLTAGAPDEKKVLETMKQATRFMMEKAAYNGGFVWSYLPDFSRRWGEIEAKPTMIWMEDPGTPSVGHLLLDMYHATGDEYYYESAKKVANALIWGQLDCGGWNYIVDFAGESSLKDWYATIGKAGWRLEEFHHYYGNATFDDNNTIGPATFLLRMYLEKYDPVYKPALDKAVGFVLESQYPNGGWPQRYPLRYDHVFQGQADYTSFITLNDAVTPNNVDFLLQCYQAAGMRHLREPILRAMYLMIALQWGAPYAGWSDQYTPEDLNPAHARSYEPRGINTGTTTRMIYLMLDYYKLTGDNRFLARIPEAIAFLESQALPESEIKRFGRPFNGAGGNILVPRFICPDTGKPQYVHRRGSNFHNGAYFYNQDIANTIGHYSSAITVNPSGLRKSYEATMALSPEVLRAKSPLFSAEPVPLEKYYTSIPRSNSGSLDGDVTALIRDINKEGFWLSPIEYSNPYKKYPKEGNAYSGNEYNATDVGDEYDTSAYHKDGVVGISTGVYISNMMKCIIYLDSKRGSR